MSDPINKLYRLRRLKDRLEKQESALKDQVLALIPEGMSHVYSGDLRATVAARSFDSIDKDALQEIELTGDEWRLLALSAKNYDTEKLPVVLQVLLSSVTTTKKSAPYPVVTKVKS